MLTMITLARMIGPWSRTIIAKRKRLVPRRPQRPHLLLPHPTHNLPPLIRTTSHHHPYRRVESPSCGDSTVLTTRPVHFLLPGLRIPPTTATVTTLPRMYYFSMHDDGETVSRYKKTATNFFVFEKICVLPRRAGLDKKSKKESSGFFHKLAFILGRAAFLAAKYRMASTP